MGLTVALLVYLNQPRLTPVEPRTAVRTNPASDTNADPQRAASPSADRHFDFYTLLPELEVVVPEDRSRSEVKEDSANERAPTQAAAQGPYVLQAGSFQRVAEADALKANLALLGVEANIQTVTVDRNTWHRVRVGPYNDLTALNRVRNRLARNRIDTVTLQER